MYEIINNNDVYFSIEEIYSIDDYINIKIFIKSNGFSGWNQFCLSKFKIEELLEHLLDFNNLNAGSYKINDFDSDSFINISATSKGRLAFDGQMGGSHNDHYMKFKFNTDQSIINQFIYSLKKIII